MYLNTKYIRTPKVYNHKICPTDHQKYTITKYVRPPNRIINQEFSSSQKGLKDVSNQKILPISFEHKMYPNTNISGHKVYPIKKSVRP